MANEVIFNSVNGEVVRNTDDDRVYFNYKIGDRVLGGVIAYIYVEGDAGYIENEQHGIVAASMDIPLTGLTYPQWGCEGTYMDTGTGLTFGAYNTIHILSRCGTRPIAASTAADFDEGGYQDWCLPSKEELNKLYLNKDIIGGFSGRTYSWEPGVTAYNYWSSSNATSTSVLNNAWWQDFQTGAQNQDLKQNDFVVRAIRYF